MAQNPLLFIVSEPVGSQLATHLAHRLADRGIRTWIGSLAPAGELKDAAMETLQNSTAALLIFDEAAAQSRHVDRHLLVARQSGKPLIPLRVQAVDEGLLRQELLDAQWIDGSDLDAAVAEISRRALDYDRARRDQADAARAAPAAAAMAAPAGGQQRAMPRIQVLPVGPEPVQAPAPGPARGRSRFASPTMLLALLALVAIVGAFLYNSSLLQRDGEDMERIVAEPTAPAEAPAATPSFNETFAAEPLAPAKPVLAAPPAEVAPPAVTPGQSEPREMADADPAPPPPAEEGRGGGGVATVRAFYSALSRGDGVTAAQHVVPAKRQSGPLSGPALSRYYSSFRRPLRIRGMTPVDGNTVRVSYDYVLGDGRLCEGQATVDVVQSGGRGLVSGISTRGPC